MGKISSFMEKNLRYIIVFVCFFALYQTIQLPIISDDAVLITQLDGKNPIMHAIETYQQWSGRLLVEGFLCFFTNHRFLFTIFLSLFAALTVYAIEKLVKKETEFSLLAGSFVILITTLDLGYLDAGFVATNLNYFILFAALLVGLENFLSIYQDPNQNISVWKILLLMFGCSSEQSIAVFCGFYVTFNLLYIIKHRQWNKKLLLFILPVLIMLGIYILSPGKQVRVAAESQLVPLYATYSLIDKVKLGIAYFFDKNFLVSILMGFFVLLGLRNLLCKKYGILIINIISIFLIKILATQDIALLPTPEEMPYYNLLFIYSFVTIILLIINVYFSADEAKIELVLALCIGIGTKVMMGLSPTYFRSGARTFIYLILILWIILIYLYKPVFQTGKEKLVIAKDNDNMKVAN